jgi:signal transduction histidine kinase
MLDLFQLKKGKFKKNESEQDVRRELGNGAIEVMRVQCEQKGLALNFKVLESVPERLIIDIQRLKQVVINLLQNA